MEIWKLSFGNTSTCLCQLNDPPNTGIDLPLQIQGETCLPSALLVTLLNVAPRKWGRTVAVKKSTFHIHKAMVVSQLELSFQLDMYSILKPSSLIRFKRCLFSLKIFKIKIEVMKLDLNEPLKEEVILAFFWRCFITFQWVNPSVKNQRGHGRNPLRSQPL